MLSNLKKSIGTVFFVLGCVYSLLYLVGCLTPYITPSSWSYITFFALGFPFLLLGMLLWLIVTIIFYRKRSWIFLLVFLAGFKNIQSTIGFHFSTNFVQQKQPNSIRVLNWNVQDFIDSQIYTDTPGNKRRDIMAFIQKMDADIVCLQDFTERISPSFRSCVVDVSNTCNYKNHFFSKDMITIYGPITTQYGTAIFSKYPIIDSGRTAYKNSPRSESLAFVDVLKGQDTIRVFTTHLQSMFIKLEITNEVLADSSLNEELDFLKNNPKAYQRIKRYDWVHAQQAILVKNQLNQSPYPFIFCADLNSVPTSYTYHHIKKNLKDAFVSKGSALSNTYDGYSPTLRIDVILMSQHFKTAQYNSPRIYASDHFPVVADLQLVH